MCSRYWIAADDDGELVKIIAALNRKGAPENVKTSGEIFPSDTVPVVANNRQLKARPFAMRWGSTPAPKRRKPSRSFRMACAGGAA